MGKVSDICKRVAKTAASYIPGVGPIVSEVIDYGFSKFENKKLEAFMQKVEKSLDSLSCEIENLKNNEFGYFYFLKATKRFIEDSEQEKKDLFAECVKNGYVSDIAAAKKLLFLNKLSEYPVQLLKLLYHLNQNNFIDESTANRKICCGTITVENAICERLPEYKENKELLRYFINTLQTDQMIYIFGTHDPISYEKAFGKWTSNIGEEFIKFIRGERL